MDINLSNPSTYEKLDLIKELWKSVIEDNISSQNFSNEINSVNHDLIKLLENYISDYTRKFYEDKFVVRNILGSRGVKYLFHFTPINNLDSILKNGLYSRNYVNENFFNYVFPDSDRYDGLNDGICLSLSFPTAVGLN